MKCCAVIARRCSCREFEGRWRRRQHVRAVDARRALSHPCTLKVATYNINGILGRLPRLLEWLRAARPHAVCLQELRVHHHEFPIDAIRDAGYDAVWKGQKPRYNGVAILARDGAPVQVRDTLPGASGDSEARYLEAAVNGILIACLYAPNGNPQPGPKFVNKLAWHARLCAHAAELYRAGVPVLLAGDFDVVPTETDI